MSSSEEFRKRGRLVNSSSDTEAYDVSPQEWQPFEPIGNMFDLSRNQGVLAPFGSKIHSVEQAGNASDEDSPVGPSPPTCSGLDASQPLLQQDLDRNELLAEPQDCFGFPAKKYPPASSEKSAADIIYHDIFLSEFSDPDDLIFSSDSSFASRKSENSAEIDDSLAHEEEAEVLHESDPNDDVKMILLDLDQQNSHSKPYPLDPSVVPGESKQDHCKRMHTNNDPSVCFSHRSDEEQRHLLDSNAANLYSEPIDYRSVESFWEKNMRDFEAGFESFKQKMKKRAISKVADVADSLQLTENVPFCSSPPENTKDSAEGDTSSETSPATAQQEANAPKCQAPDSFENFKAIRNHLGCGIVHDSVTSSFDSSQDARVAQVSPKKKQVSQRSAVGGTSPVKRTHTTRISIYSPDTQNSSVNTVVATKVTEKKGHAKKHEFERKKHVISKSRQWAVSQRTPSPQSNIPDTLESTSSSSIPASTLQRLQQPILEPNTTLPARFGDTLDQPRLDAPRVFPVRVSITSPTASQEDKKLRADSNKSPTSVADVLQVQGSTGKATLSPRGRYEAMLREKATLTGVQGTGKATNSCRSRYEAMLRKNDAVALC